ncbi:MULTISPECIES: aldo/keto reductase [unclassified Gordonia (in: high G+C Gram-positive bacteria)]|uniref:aldo/keto reductase n=1 Tax=unclassified Gordonia (in: high G+C Gram-positive bacteria) TaxID=2657482 RepID=UPI001F05208A|nr:aldo/keto reductase [Gordonia sp. PDNC005]
MSEIGYGSMGVAVGYGTTDVDEAVAAIRRAHDLGVTHFDTAEMYGWGAGERLVGRAIKPFRENVTVATKFGMTKQFGVDSHPDHIRRVVDASLLNLDVDYIDVLYQHRLDPAVPIEDVVGVMGELVDAGKVRYLGLSEATPDALRAAHAVHPISVLQTEFSIFAQDALPLFPLLDELGIGFIAYAPLARGFLTGAPRPAAGYERGDFRTFMEWWNKANYSSNLGIVERLTAIGESRGVSLPQLALSWVLAQGDFIVPIPGSRNPDRVAENIAAADLKLTDVDLRLISDAAPHGAHGDRGTPSPWLG